MGGWMQPTRCSAEHLFHTRAQIRGWDLATLQSPAAAHLALTLPTAANADVFVSDLRLAVQMLRDQPEKYTGGTAGMYGTASKLPAGFVEESAKVYLDTMTVAADDAAAAEGA